MMKYLISIVYILLTMQVLGQSKIKEVVDGICFNMVPVEYGTFQMGTTDLGKEEQPVHSITLNAFYMMDTEITQGQWKAIMETNPSFYKGDSLPVEQVNWDEVMEFIKRLNEKSGRTYRLPTEAEWEYAARGGNKSQGYKYSGSNDINEVGWCFVNSANKTHKVGSKKPNELGIYDMTGNVFEWCNDYYMPNIYEISPSNNPTGAFLSTGRVIRGGSCNASAKMCLTTKRAVYTQYKSTRDVEFRMNIGFRLVHSR